MTGVSQVIVSAGDTRELTILGARFLDVGGGDIDGARQSNRTAVEGSLAFAKWYPISSIGGERKKILVFKFVSLVWFGSTFSPTKSIRSFL